MPSQIITLPEPRYVGDVSVEKALFERRSFREFGQIPITLDELAQLLWAAQGITHGEGYRTIPSAGALYPLEVYAAAGNVKDLAAGIYKYVPSEHALSLHKQGAVTHELCRASLDQDCVKNAAVVILLAAITERTTQKYGDRGIRYIHMEAGHAVQNVYLQSVSLDLGAVVVGAFQDKDISTIMNLKPDEQPVCLMAVGKK